jgi:hypothetical protein
VKILLALLLVLPLVLFLLLPLLLLSIPLDLPTLSAAPPIAHKPETPPALAERWRGYHRIIVDRPRVNRLRGITSNVAFVSPQLAFG